MYVCLFKLAYLVIIYAYPTNVYLQVCHVVIMSYSRSLVAYETTQLILFLKKME